MNRLISIIIPVYKTPEKLLANCINSCINQTFKDIEIILVDDGSPDNCGDICENFKKKDNRITVIHQKNKGLSGARNTGIKNSSSEWLFFLDADDYIDERLCEKLYNCKNENESDVICCSYIRKDITGKEIEKCPFNEIEERLYKGKECKFLQEKVLNFNSYISTACCKLIKKELLLKNNILFNEILKQGAEDIEFSIRLFEYSNAVYIKKDFLYYYICNINSITREYNEQNYYYVLSCFDTIKKFIEKNSNKDILLKMFYNRLAYVIITAGVSGYFNVSNTESFNIKKEKYLKYLEQPLVKECLKKCDIKTLDIKRKIIFILIKLKMIRILNLLVLIFR